VEGELKEKKQGGQQRRQERGRSFLEKIIFRTRAKKD
jgi:hypothetical protein